MKYRTLSNGVKVPYVGYGTWTLDDETVVPALLEAFELGYRRIDTAGYYDNEIGIGKAIKESKIPREELFVATKAWYEHAGYQETLDIFEESMKKLDLEYVDMLLIHWPTHKDADTWRAMEELYESGRVKAIGVCNYEEKHMETLMKTAKIKPMVNQIERHPLHNRNDLLKYFLDQDVAIEASSPLARRALLENEILAKLAKKYDVSISQLILRWHYQSDVITFPKSANRQRMKENISIFNFEITSDDMIVINNLDEKKRISGYPDFYDNL